jgi:integrase
VYVTGGTNKFKQVFEPDPIADVYVSELTSEAIREWVYRVIGKERMHPHRSGGRRSTNTVRRAYQVMRNVCARAFEKGLLSGNPAVGVKLPRAKKRRRELLAAGIEEKAPSTTYSEEELHQFWSCELVPLPVRLWHAILVGTGMRAGEFAEALIEDVHLDADDPSLHLRDTKNGRPHDVRLFGVALRAMARWMEMLPTYCEDNPHKLLWPGPHGGKRSKGHWWGKISVKAEGGTKKAKQLDAFPIYLARAGITRHFRTHDTRHTCGTALVSGAWGPAWSLELVKEQFNYSDISVTQRYARAGETALKKAARTTTGPQVEMTSRRPRAKANWTRIPTNSSGGDASSGFEKLAVNARNRSVGRPGLEPGTYGLKVRSSTD